jgi:hypothetical protein
MKRIPLTLSVAAIALCMGCALEEQQPGLQLITNVYDFRESDHAWIAGFCDYPAEQHDSDLYELKSGYVNTTISGRARNAYSISGYNHSDDLFMYLKKKITGLQPDTQYILTYEIEFASDLSGGNLSDGAAGQKVFMKVGASDSEPKSVIDDAGNYIMNIDKGNQGSDGEDMIVIGNIVTTELAEGLEVITRSNSPSTATEPAYDKRFVVKTNSKGELWLIVGTDSGFDGRTTLYYTSISTVLSAPY